MKTHSTRNKGFLTDCHRNPTLEEQALARIHRIGQTQEVTTIRFYVRDSFEEVIEFIKPSYPFVLESHHSRFPQQVMKLQTKKKQLAGVLLAPRDGGDTDDDLGRLHVSQYWGYYLSIYFV